MAREYRSQITGDPQGRTFGNLVDAAGRVVLEGVSFVPTNVTQQGDKWRAQAANLVANLDEATGTAVLAIDEGQAGAERGTIKVFRSAAKPAALPHGRFCLTPNGLFVGNAANLPTPAGPVGFAKAPTANDDSTKGYAVGNVWIVGYQHFDNLVSSEWNNTANWTITGNRATIAADASGQINIGGQAPTAIGGMLSGVIGNIPRNHVIYVFAQLRRGATCTIATVKIIDENGRDAVILTGRNDLNARNCWHGLFTPQNNIFPAKYSIESNYESFSGTTMQLAVDGISVIDLTASLGAGNEYTLEEAYNVFSGYTNYQDSFFVGTPAAYICVSPAPGAANWKQLALEV